MLKLPHLLAGSFACVLLLVPVRADDEKPPAKLPPPAEGKIDFDADVRPILAARCVKCHGPAKQKGGLRLDTRAHALAGGNSGAALAVGKGAESKLIHAVARADPDLAMPPKDAERLTAAEVGKLRAWIDQGAKWGGAIAAQGGAKSDHWAFRPIKRPKVPVITNHKSQINNALDAFVLARLRKEGLAPGKEADRATVIRRVSFDLTGLPPTPEEVDAFLKDASPDAYEKVVDRLLASPHYGERWARHWVDAGR
jgi:hypothetical protein